MGTRSKYMQKKKRRPAAEYLTSRPPLDHQATKREAYAFVKGHPETSALELAQGCEHFDGSRVIAASALNSLRNDGFVTRVKNRFTIKEL